MKDTGRILVLCGLVSALLVFTAAPAFSQTDKSLDLTRIENVFDDFADGMAGALPLNSSIGLNWSDAYIGQLLRVPPNVGFGVSVGATTIPYAALKSAADDLGADLPGIADTLGLPMPGYTVEARMGGIIWPFDIGLKVGALPDSDLFLPSGWELDYLLVGGDIRVPILHGRGPLPVVSAGVGFNYLRGGVTASGVLGDITVAEVEYGTGGETANVVLTDPKLEFEWSSRVLDFKLQASKRFFVITPYLGLGASYAWSEAGGGVKSSLDVQNISGGESAEDVKAAIRNQYPQFDTDGFAVTSDVTGFGLRTFGGFSFNVLIARLDFTLMYDFLGQNLGATTGARIQL
ncbi:MAG: hypothetical protein EA428_12230 [Spirochaetaceae bacterium]|nr:MAG: hypothetical protein EA428_12230 [Spirochaetaceae bacterium]